MTERHITDRTLMHELDTASKLSASADELLEYKIQALKERMDAADSRWNRVIGGAGALILMIVGDIVLRFV